MTRVLICCLGVSLLLVGSIRADAQAVEGCVVSRAELREADAVRVRVAGARFIVFPCEGVNDPDLAQFLALAEAVKAKPIPRWEAYRAPYDFALEDRARVPVEWEGVKRLAAPLAQLASVHPSITSIVYDAGKWNWTFADRYMGVQYCLGRRVTLLAAAENWPRWGKAAGAGLKSLEAFNARAWMEFPGNGKAVLRAFGTVHRPWDPTDAAKAVSPAGGPFPAPATAYDFKRLKGEALGRGTVVVRRDETHVTVSWRYLMSDPRTCGFDVYCNGKKVTAKPVRESTWLSLPYEGAATYTVKGTHEAAPRAGARWTIGARAPIGYVELPLGTPPPAGEIPATFINKGEKYSYFAEDCSIGDLDGDGEMELVVNWAPTNARDNSHAGATGAYYLEAFKLSTGRSLWRVNLGINIRAGAHYLPFMVYDLDNDGRAEVVCRVSDGTVDGKGKVWGDAKKDWREKSGQVIFAPLFTAVFDGRTGAILARDPWPKVLADDWRCCRGWINGWFDRRDRDGNRPFRFLSAIAYLDGVHPSVVMCRGYYTRTILHAYDWDGRTLKTRWRFDSHKDKKPEYGGQGFHNLRVADVDRDGRDEIIYGQMVMDDNGQGLYTTGMGHGDAMNLIQLTPQTPGLQVWTCQENRRDGGVLRDAGTGQVLFQLKSDKDVPRAVAGDVDGDFYGTEFWAASGINLWTADFRPHRWGRPGMSYLVWWGGELTRDMFHGKQLSNFSLRAGRGWTTMVFAGSRPNPGTKCVPPMSGDIFGDWREEVVMRAEDGKSLRIYLTPESTAYRFWTFLQDPVYRISVATQNCGYNQPPQPGFYFGPDLKGHAIWWRGTYLP